jgi:molybdopterin synthase sulfur carrier subunit
MALDMLYFAWVREAIGRGEERVEPPAKVRTIADLIGWLAERTPGHATALADVGRVRAASDGVFASLDTPIAGVREIALFPPVTGG